MRRERPETVDRGAQDKALQAYLAQMSAMLMPTTGQPSLYEALPGDSLSSVARARTLTVLPRLDGERKARVVQFLYECRLITRGRLVLDLRGADLSRADLRETDLSEAYLNGAYLSGAYLSGADLSGAILRRADLSGADLRGANVIGTILRGANLRGAFLSGAILRGAFLSGADLGAADLFLADLRGADLREVTLSGAEVEQWQIDEASSLEGAAMPNGQKYENWLKDGEGRAEGGRVATSRNYF